jgi:hypothetical protein
LKEKIKITGIVMLRRVYSRRGRVSKGKVKEGECGLRYFLHMYEYGTLNPVEVILRRGRCKRESNGGDEPNWGTIYVYMEMSQ